MKTIDLQPVTRPDVTIIPNSIIDQDMLEANELQLKVYLYILRNVGAGIPVHISSMADHFNETEKDITRAVAFWEKRGVFSACQDAPYGEFSRDDLRAMKNSQDFKELSFVAETYMGKPLSRSDCNTLLFIKDSLNFSNELIEFLLEYCAERGKKSFKYVQTVACAWSKQGITTPEEAQARGIMYSQRIYAVMNALGKKSEPTNAELNYIERWYQ
ncbi:MAG: DnaD domain protein, partial [Lachnospiraceae bacterium]|nr:DnaD domain protein [Lachnospiraceae bacterium]